MSLFALLLAVAAPAASQAEVAAYRALIEQDLRLATVSYTLASANAPFCTRKARSLGWVLHDERQYPDRTLAAAAFTFRQPVSAAAVVAGAPADRVGIRPGDGLVAVNENAWSWKDSAQAEPTGQRLETVLEAIDRDLAASGPIEIAIDTAKGVRRLRLDAPAICASRFWVDVRDKLDAGADGEKVRITSGMMQFLADDNELAAVVAHELAHNILGHRARLDAAKRGKTKAVLATEIEADRLSVWMMANAGYDPAGALRFTERHGRKYGFGIFSDGTHLRWKNRVTVMQAEIALMARTPRIDGKLPPPLLASK